MSIDIQHIKSLSDGKVYWYTRNSGVRPIAVNLYEKIEDVPKSIRQYCNDSHYIRDVGPGSAHLLGIKDIFYPNFPKCGHPRYLGDECIAEMCIYCVNGDWTRCKYFRKVNPND